ncbi:hypothetical protein FGG08_000602 [Glutinoglossum americanum]|uniref:Uncharacterized protein n=1 Tax=Glutinoglossum americanum TaxID=1670608 RepID=A0A9P8IHX8_9PEZI|nr:hypothetical protein FGG08_000602 [Glutinoglossum americanum]
MDDWGSPWADDAGTRQLSSSCPAGSERDLSSPNLEAQSTNNILTDLDRSSLWADDGGLGEWANVGSSPAPIGAAFPDWSTETSTIAPASPSVEKNDPNIQNQPKPLWEDEAGLHMDTVELGPQWRAGSSHDHYAAPVTKPTPSSGGIGVGAIPESLSEGGAVTFSNGDRGKGKVGIPQDSLEPTVLLTHRGDDRSAAITDHRTKLPPKGNIEEGDFSSRPSSSPASEKYIEAGAIESPRTSLEEEAAQLGELKFRPSSPQRQSEPIRDPVFTSQDPVDDGEVDFGDFEEENKCAKDRDSDLEPLPAECVIPREYLKQGQEALGVAEPRMDLEVVAFKVDMSLLDQLIPPNHSTDLLPGIQGDIISSTSSRKTWYRISRKETVKEHNCGNGDYVRVTWNGSSIQANVSKIVARWVTEDRIAGGMVLGGGNRLGAIFGWGEDKPGIRRASEKSRAGSKNDLNNSPPLGLQDKALSLKIAPRPSLPVTRESNESFAIDTLVGSTINIGAGETSLPAPQFNWSTSGEGVKQLAQDTSWSTTGKYQKPISMRSMPNSVSPTGSLSPPSATSYPSLWSRPASLDLSGRKTSESSHTRGSKSVGFSNVRGPRAVSSVRTTIQTTGPAPLGAPLVGDSNLIAAKAELGVPKELCNPWAPANPPTFSNRVSTQISQVKPLPSRELGVFDIPKPNRDAGEDEIVDRTIKGLPNLAYMLR